MGTADRDRHPTDPHGQRIARDQPRAVQRLNRNALVEAQFAQTPRVALGQRRPVDTGNRGFVLKGKVGKCHLRAIISNIC